MKTASQFAEVARQAARDTAVVMTAQLRQECVASGWSAALANKLKVRYVGGEFKVIIPEDIKDKKVTSKKQAIAIALSEQRKADKKK